MVVGVWHEIRLWANYLHPTHRYDLVPERRNIALVNRPASTRFSLFFRGDEGQHTWGGSSDLDPFTTFFAKVERFG